MGGEEGAASQALVDTSRCTDEGSAGDTAGKKDCSDYVFVSHNPIGDDVEYLSSEIQRVDLETVVSALKDHENDIPAVHARKDSIIVLGDSRAGKSTTVNYLTNISLASKPIKVECILDGQVFESVKDVIDVAGDVAVGSRICKIGHQADAETEHVTAIPVKIESGQEFIFCDTPGFVDSKGVTHDIISGCKVHRVVEMSSTCRPLLLLNATSLTNPGYLQNQKNALERLFHPLDEHLSSVFALYTHVSASQDWNAITQTLMQFRESKMAKSDQSFQKFLTHLLKSLMKHKELLIIRPLEAKSIPALQNAITATPSIDPVKSNFGSPFTDTAATAFDKALLQLNSDLTGALESQNIKKTSSLLDLILYLEDAIPRHPGVIKSKKHAINEVNKSLQAYTAQCEQSIQQHTYKDMANSLEKLRSFAMIQRVEKQLQSNIDRLRTNLMSVVKESVNSIKLGLEKESLTKDHAGALQILTDLVNQLSDFIPLEEEEHPAFLRDQIVNYAIGQQQKAAKFLEALHRGLEAPSKDQATDWCIKEFDYCMSLLNRIRSHFEELLLPDWTRKTVDHLEADFRTFMESAVKNTLESFDELQGRSNTDNYSGVSVGTAFTILREFETLTLSESVFSDLETQCSSVEFQGQLTKWMHTQARNLQAKFKTCPFDAKEILVEIIAVTDHPALCAIVAAPLQNCISLIQRHVDDIQANAICALETIDFLGTTSDTNGFSTLYDSVEDVKSHMVLDGALGRQIVATATPDSAKRSCEACFQELQGKIAKGIRTVVESLHEAMDRFDFARAEEFLRYLHKMGPLLKCIDQDFTFVEVTVQKFVTTRCRDFVEAIPTETKSDIELTLRQQQECSEFLSTAITLSGPLMVKESMTLQKHKESLRGVLEACADAWKAHVDSLVEKAGSVATTDVQETRECLIRLEELAEIEHPTLSDSTQRSYEQAKTTVTEVFRDVFECAQVALQTTDLTKAMESAQQIAKANLILSSQVNQLEEWHRIMSSNKSDYVKELASKFRDNLRQERYTVIKDDFETMSKSKDPVDQQRLQSVRLLLEKELLYITNNLSNYEMHDDDDLEAEQEGIKEFVKQLKHVARLDVLGPYFPGSFSDSIDDKKQAARDLFDNLHDMVTRSLNNLKLENAYKVFKLMKFFSQQVDPLWEDVDLSGKLADVKTRIEKIPNRLAARLAEGFGSWDSVGADPDPVLINRVFRQCKIAAERNAFHQQLDFEQVQVDIKKFALGKWKEVVNHAESLLNSTPDLKKVESCLGYLQEILSCEIFENQRKCQSDFDNLSEDLKIRRSQITERLFNSTNIDDLQSCVSDLARMRVAEFAENQTRFDGFIRDRIKSVEQAQLQTSDGQQSAFGVLQGLNTFVSVAEQCSVVNSDLQRLVADVQARCMTCETVIYKRFESATDGLAKLFHDRRYTEAAEICVTLLSVPIPKGVSDRLRGQLDQLKKTWTECQAEISSKQRRVEDIHREASEWNLSTRLIDRNELAKKLDQLQTKQPSRRASLSCGGPTANNPYLEVVENLNHQLENASSNFDRCIAEKNWKSAYLLKENSKHLVELPEFKDKKCVAKDLTDKGQTLLKSHLTSITKHLRAQSFKNLNDEYENMRSIEDVGLYVATDDVINLISQQIHQLINQSNVRGIMDSPTLSRLMIKIKSMSSKIKDQVLRNAVQKILKQFADPQLKAMSPDNVLQVGCNLENEGPLGEELLTEFPIFESLVIKKMKEVTDKMTLSDALADLQQSEEISETQSRILRKLHSQYEQRLEQLLTKMCGFSGFTEEALSNVIDEVKQDARSLSSKTNNDFPKLKKKLPELIAGVCAVWIATRSRSLIQSPGEPFIIRPHPIQVLSMFKLLSLDEGDPSWIFSQFSRSRPKLRGSLVQVGTGEGKSILLGVLAAVLALLGFEVSTACYNEHLCNRDRVAFEPLFNALGTEGSIAYKTLECLANEEIEAGGDVRQLATCLLNGESVSGDHTRQHTRRRILLIDEVDMFFTASFYGGSYHPAVSWGNLSVKTFIKWLWSRKNSVPPVAEAQARREWQQIITAYPKNQPLLISHLRQMIRDLKSLKYHDYKVFEGMIGYAANGKISTTTSFGYLTMFAYLQEAERGTITSEVADRQLKFEIICGSFSYAEMPKKFECILGATGTLESMTNEEIDLITSEYDISNFTIMPSIYGPSQMDFKENSHSYVVLTNDEREHHQKIQQECLKKSENNRPVLVLFASAEALANFRSSEYGQRLADVNVIQETTPDRDIEHLIKRATAASTITLLTRAFGRGTDFVCLDKNVERSGGIHVIQTFLSDDPSEEKQIKGRTARQGKQGSFQIILLASDLNTFGISEQQARNAQQHDGFYRFLVDKRDMLQDAKLQQLRIKANAAKDNHKKSLKLQSALCEASKSPQWARHAMEQLLAFN